MYHVIYIYGGQSVKETLGQTEERDREMVAGKRWRKTSKSFTDNCVHVSSMCFVFGKVLDLEAIR